jgi:hypothetical protein
LIEKQMSEDPEIADAYVLYRECRGQQIYSMEKAKKGGKGSVIQVIIWPTGYNMLPDGGPLLEQSHRLMSFFDIFLNEERSNAMETLNK